MTILCLSQNYANINKFDLYDNFKDVEVDKDGRYTRYKFGEK